MQLKDLTIQDLTSNIKHRNVSTGTIVLYIGYSKNDKLPVNKNDNIPRGIIHDRDEFYWFKYNITADSWLCLFDFDVYINKKSALTEYIQTLKDIEDKKMKMIELMHTIIMINLEKNLFQNIIDTFFKTGIADGERSIRDDIKKILEIKE